MMAAMMMMIFGNGRSYETTAATIRLLTCYSYMNTTLLLGLFILRYYCANVTCKVVMIAMMFNRYDYLTSYTYRYSGCQSFDEVIRGKAMIEVVIIWCRGHRIIPIIISHTS